MSHTWSWSCPRVEVLSLPHHFIANELEGKQYVVCTQLILDEWLNKYINVLMQNLYSKMSRKTSIFNLVNYFLYISWKEGFWPGGSLSLAVLTWKITGAQMLSECLLSTNVKCLEENQTTGIFKINNQNNLSSVLGKHFHFLHENKNKE